MRVWGGSLSRALSLLTHLEDGAGPGPGRVPPRPGWAPDGLPRATRWPSCVQRGVAKDSCTLVWDQSLEWAHWRFLPRFTGFCRFKARIPASVYSRMCSELRRDEGWEVQN